MIFNLYHVVSFSIILFFSLILSIQDIKTLSASVFLQWISIFCALICHLIFNRTGMWIYILSSMITGTFYFAVRKITRNKLGPADVWFGFFQGLFLIPKMLPFCLGIECFAALCVIIKKIGRQTFPFIPVMSIGLIFSFIAQFILGRLA